MSARAEVWSCGGGTQSVTIGALIISGRLPKPDEAAIVDTEREKGSTWQYAEAVLIPALASVGVELHRVRMSDWAKETVWDLKGEHLLIPAFSSQTVGSMGKLTNFCTDKWKVRVQDRWLRSRGVRSTRKWLGLSLDEPRRWIKHLDKPDVRLPLVTDVPMRRHDCLRLVREMGWPEPPRSNCWMCPNQSDDEWRETLRNRPDEFAAAVKLEREIQERDPHAFLHGSGVPLDQVDWTKPPSLFERACNSGECFT